MLITLVLAGSIVIIVDYNTDCAPNEEPDGRPVPTCTHVQTCPPTPRPTDRLMPVDILLNDLIANDVADKDNYTKAGGAKDVHICGNMAVEQANWIEDEYGYEVGVVLMWYKFLGDGHASTWVIIDDERYIIESTSHTWWTEAEHKAMFGELYKIRFVPTKKGAEHAKLSAELYRSG